MKFPLILCIVLSALSNELAVAEVSRQLPDITLPILNSVQTLSLKQQHGKVIYIDIWASNCAACILSMPELERMRTDIHTKNFEILSINLDRIPEDAKHFMREYHVTNSVASDAQGKILTALDVSGLPAGFLVDATGKIRLIHQGYVPGQSSFLKAHIEKLLQERAVEMEQKSNISSERN